MYRFAARMRHILITLLVAAVLNMVFFVPQYERLSSTKCPAVNAFVENEEHVASVLYHICAEWFENYFPPVSTNVHFLEKDYLLKRSVRNIIYFLTSYTFEVSSYKTLAQLHTGFLYVPVVASILDGFVYIGRFTPF